MTKCQQLSKTTRALSVLRTTTNLPQPVQKPRPSLPNPEKKSFSNSWLYQSPELKDYVE